ncbi:MAG TPA: PEP-CTERM sorting domain-containing protein [Opitutaceae bacterium]|nr:PEP-CTERM sorting domain-containing protein [Opitutaceae bacterium]
MKLLSSLLALLVASTSTLAQTTIVWDNFSAGDTYSSSGAWAGMSGGTAYGTASAFTPTASGQFDSFTAAIHSINTSAFRPFTLTLTTSVDGKFGTTLWTTATQTIGNSSAGLFSLTDIGGPALSAGTEYWMILTSTADGAAVNWRSALPGNPAGTTSVANLGSSTNYYTGADGRVMRVGVSAIPEPSTYAMCCGVAVLGFAMIRRRFVR